TTKPSAGNRHRHSRRRALRSVSQCLKEADVRFDRLEHMIWITRRSSAQAVRRHPVLGCALAACGDAL
ncbi:MAG: hypothetical protein KDA91_25140, partial [Planctomycetaceae bacterium]|nr:hypothetical protein [Planctomycetaceae bacterium]